MSSSLMHALVFVPTALAAALAMDLWAAFLHGRVWHRTLWFIHASHHEARRGRFEANDVLSVTHAPFAIAFILYGCIAPPTVTREIVFGAGLGMTLFGLAYLIVHDGLVHHRLPVRFLLRSRYLRAVVRAHLVHHTGLSGGPPYGFVLGPLELRRADRSRAPESDDPRGATHSRSTSRGPLRVPKGQR